MEWELLAQGELNRVELFFSVEGAVRIHSRAENREVFSENHTSFSIVSTLSRRMSQFGIFVAKITSPLLVHPFGWWDEFEVTSHPEKIWSGYCLLTWRISNRTQWWLLPQFSFTKKFAQFWEFQKLVWVSTLISKSAHFARGIRDQQLLWCE